MFGRVGITVKPGDTVRYRIQYRNIGSGSIDDGDLPDRCMPVRLVTLHSVLRWI